MLQPHAASRAHLDHWIQTLADTPPALELPLIGARERGRKAATARCERAFGTALSTAMRELAATLDATLFETVLSGWLALLHRTARQTDLIVGVAPATGGGVLPLRFEVTAETSFAALLREVRTVLEAGAEHASAGIDAILETLGHTRSELFQVGFAMSARPEGLDGTDVVLLVREDRDTLHATIEYDATLFDEATVRRALGHLETLLGGAAGRPRQRVGHLPLLTDGERRQILRDWNDTAIDFPEQECLHTLFEERVAARPDSVAATFRGEQLTYRELDTRANQVAHHLRSMGIGPDALVGISVERSFEMVVGLMAIAKAGGAYVPMDPAYPTERLAFMLEDSGVEVLLTQRHLADSIPPTSAAVVFLEDRALFDARDAERPDSGVTADNLSYVIYTSGSTGAPKGVVLDHRGRVNNFLDFNRRFDVGERDGLIALSSLSFDMCAYDVFGTLAAGATIVLPDPEQMQDPAHWARLMNDHRVTVWHSAPALLKMLVDHLETCPELAPQSLRLVLLGGDWIPVSLPDRLRALVDGVQVISMGGATECSMDSTIYEVLDVDPAWKSIPYGEPMANQRSYVLDAQHQLLPIGVPGELYLGGVGVAWGYHRRPGLTAERFLPDPFAETTGARMYRTGDLARWMPDGNLELLGRIDNQVKIRGYRIELGEIESRLRAHPAVKEGVVSTVQEGSDKRLVAYVVQDPAWPGSERDQEVLQSEQVGRWQAVYDSAYSANVDGGDDPTFNIVSWDSSYTKRPLPADEMRVWVDQTVDRIRAHRPRRVLEIGCGMGLLLFRLAPDCEHYLGTDLSPVALDYVRVHANRLDLRQVELSRRGADDFWGIDEDSLDAVVLNSIVFDFPSMDYLLRVLEGAVRAVKPGGIVWVGDVQNLALAEAFQRSVELYQARNDLAIDELERRVRRSLRHDEEMLIDPRFFVWLQARLPKIGRVQTQLKRGAFTNELTAYRYDVTLHIGPRTPTATGEPRWLDWEADRLGLGRLREILGEERPSWLVVRAVPNQRVRRDVLAGELVRQRGGPRSAGELRAALDEVAPGLPGVNPEDVFGWSDRLPYDVDLRWSSPLDEGRFDIALRRRPEDGAPVPAALFPDDTGLAADASAQATDFATNPLMGKLSRQLGPELRRHLSRQLPDYMVPAVYVPLDALPLSPNGKVDRKALPAPDTSRPDVDSPYQAPTTAAEELIAGIWTDVLGLDRVGVNDGFLDLGGHSLLAVQIQARLGEIFPFRVTLPDIFEARTVARLAAHVVAEGARQGIDVDEVCRTLRMIESMSDEEVESQNLAGEQ